INTSPLFYLHRLDCIHILEKLYGNILIPEAVVNELKEGKTVGEDVPEIEDYGWITVKNVVVPAFIKIIPELKTLLKEACHAGQDHTQRNQGRCRGICWPFQHPS
ncbi:MAG: hypothetical protein M0Z64_02610, partial [Nitrospiraceae bacterium]|nr:hypothetical protein [Nitrospiraceae bacterium]